MFLSYQSWSITFFMGIELIYGIIGRVKERGGFAKFYEDEKGFWKW